MLTLKFIFALCCCSSFSGVVMVVADIDAQGWGLILAGLGTLATTVVGALILWANNKTNNRIKEMEAEAKLKKVEDAAHQKIMEVRAEAQKAVSLVNAGTLSNLQTAVASNTMETVKATVAADQAKQRIEQLEAKLPVQRSEAEAGPADVHVVNSPDDPVNTKPQ